jgi:hypothetical protein
MKAIPEFSFKIRLTPKRSIISIVVASILVFITTKCEISKEDVLKFYNELRRVVKLDVINKNEILKEFDNQLNEKINRTPELLDYKVKRELDYALIDYENQEKKSRVVNMKNKNILEEINKPKYDELQKLIIENAVYYEFAPDTSKAQELLGPTMGIRGAWVSPDPREIKD